MAKIMVVDDAPFMRMRAVKLLKENGHECIEAGNGVEAIERYKAEKPDAVMMDITMPDMDGLEALKALKQIDSNVRITMVTAMGQQSIVMEAIKAGAKDFIVKPFDPNRVMGALEKMLG
ncbi:MAG: response regulator [Chloroflexota bacterium]|nr:response regulator [Chloroflexota bacterium]